MGNDEGVKRCLDELAEGRQGGGAECGAFGDLMDELGVVSSALK